MSKRKVQEINASSMADIAFLLLIFFLVTTTMSVDKGLSRRLPPPLPPNMEKPNTDVKKRNIFVVLINSNNQLLVQGEPLDVKQLREKAKTFIKNEAADPSLPEVLPIEVEIDGQKETVLTTKNHLISLQNDRGTLYQKYIEVRMNLWLHTTSCVTSIRGHASEWPMRSWTKIGKKPFKPSIRRKFRKQNPKTMEGRNNGKNS